MTLEWRQLPTTEICHVTACGRYSVGFDAQHSVWRSYRLAPGGPWFAQIGTPQSGIGDAQQICEDDVRNGNQPGDEKCLSR
jgi:hypothetical protein